MAVVDTKRTLPEWAQCVLEKVETLTQEAATAERHGNVVTLERVAALIRENAPVSTPEPSGQTLAGAGGEVAAFERWARGRFSGAEVFDRIESRPANEIGLTWEYNGYAVQSAWAAWIGRATITATSAGTTGDDSEDAARYRWLRDKCKREWESDMPHNKGAPSLDIEFEAPGHDLDAAIDAARRAWGESA